MPSKKTFYGPATVTDADPLQVQDEAGEAHVGEVGGRIIRAARELIRPADVTPYTNGDIVSDSTSATTPQPLAVGRKAGGQGYIVGVNIESNNPAITPTLRVHLYDSASITVPVDNAPATRIYANNAHRIGYVDVGPLATGANSGGSTGAWAQEMTVRVPYVCAAADQNIYYVLEILSGAWTPTSGGKITVTTLVEAY